MRDAERYRQRAIELDALVATLADPDERMKLEAVARAYRRLAEHIESTDDLAALKPTLAPALK